MRLVRASLVSLLLVCLLTGAVDAQTCTPLTGVSALLEGAQYVCRTSTGGTYTAVDYGGGTSTHQWVYSSSSSGPWTPIAGATGTTYHLTGSDFPSNGLWWVAVTATPQCGSPITGGAQSVTVYDTLPAPEMYGNDQICADATNAVAQSAAQWDSYSWSIQHGTLIAGPNGCSDDATKKCVSFRPDGTGNVTLTLTVTAGSCSATGTRIVPLTPNAPPELSIYGPVCPGSGAGAYTSQGPAGVRTWSVTRGHLDSDWGDHIFFTPDGSGPVEVSLTFTDANGCSSTSTATAQLAGTKPVITLGTPACSSGTASASGGWGSYQWSITNGSITSGQGTANVSYSSNQSGAMTLTVTGRTDWSTWSCMVTSDPVTVPSVPTPTITLGTADICPFGTDTATAPAGYANYWWYVNNGYINSGDNTSSITFSRGGYPNNPSDPITVTLYVADANGCSAPQASVTVPTRSIPAPAITLGTPDICPFGTNTATVPPQYANYWWSLNNGYITGGDGTNSITFVRGGYPGHLDEPISVTLYVQNADGCPAPQSTVTVPTRSIAAPVITLGTPDICPFGTNTATVPAQYANYWWSLNNGYVISGDGTNSITFQRGGYPGGTAESISVTLYVQDANGCPAPQATVTVPIRTIPAPVITLATPDICKYGTNTASVPAQYANYWWSLNNGYITGGDGTSSITFQPGGYPSGNTDPISVTLYVQDANGCPAPQSTVTVPIRTIPAPVITLATPDVCKFGTNTASVPPQYANYWWSIDGGYITAGDGTPSITFQPGGGMPGSSGPVTITLFAQDANGCPAPQATVTVPIRTIPAPTITLATPDICPYGTNTASVPAQYANYYWSISGGSITSGDNTSSITFQRSGMPGSTDPVTLSLSVQDANGCPVNAVPITVPIRTIAAPQITLGAASICANATGTASVPASYANYSWTIAHGTIVSGDITNAITFRADGTGDVALGVSVVDGNGCLSSTSSATVTFDPVNATVTAGGPTTFCAGGSVTLTAAAGYASYAWSNGGSGQSLIATTSGSYTVTVTSAGGCSAISAATVVTVNPVPTPHIVVSQQYTALAPSSYVLAQVSGDNSYTYCGTATVGLFATGGGSGSQYHWSTGQQTPQITVTQSGVYTVTITNAEGCSADDNVTININPIPTATITASGPLDICPNGGSVVLTANTADSYLWSTGATTQSIVVSQPGAYHVAVTTGGCTATSNDVDVTVRSSGVISGGRTFCPGGSVTLTAPAGSSYAWNTGATTQSITVSSAGDYSVTVTDATGCSMTPPAATVVASSLAVSVSASATTICEGQTSTLTANATGGSGNYGYQWFNYAGAIAGATSISYSASAPDEYYVVATDAGGCSVSTTNQRVVLAVNSNPTSYIYVPQGFCSGATNTVSAAPLTGVTYAWTVTNGTLQSSSGNTAVIIAGTSGSVTIGVTVTNANGCTWSGTQTVPIVQPPPVPVITASGPTTFCQGDQVTLTAPAGYSYTWRVGSTVFDTTQSITTGIAGSYTVTVTNASGCSTTSQPVVVTVNSLPDANVTAPASVCASTYGENASVPSIAGGSYAWTISGGTITNGAGTRLIAFKPSGSGPVTIGVTVINANGCAASSSSVVDVHSVPKPAVTPSGAVSFCNSGVLSAPAGYTSYSWKLDGGQIVGASGETYVATQSGTYSVIVWDATNCSVESDPISVTVSTTPMAGINAQSSVCAGSTYGATSAASAYSYQWSVANGTLVDGQGTNIIHYLTGSSGDVTLTLTVANAQGCSATRSVTVPIDVVQATITPSGPLTICPGASVTLTASPGSGYSWSNSLNTQSITVTQAGTYTVRVFNAAGCNTLSQPVTVSVASPSATITTSGPTTFCSGSNVTLSAPAGYGSYSWNNGATTQSITVNQSNTYTVTVQDANGCTASSSSTVTVRPLPTATVSGGGAVCPGGSATITAALTGTAPWNVTWSDNVTQTITTGTTATRSVNPAVATTYTVTSLTDANCNGTSSGSAAVTIKARPTATVSGGGAICPGGSATITATLTGIAPWSVTWSDSVTQTITTGTSATRSVSPAAASTYTVTSLTDANCSGTSSGSAAVTIKTLPTATVSGGGTICPGGSATITAALTGTAPWSVTWSDNLTQTINSGTTALRSVSPAATTTYTVTSVSDAASCPRAGSGSAAVTVKAPASITTQPSNQTTTRNTNVTLSVVAAGTAPISYQWFNGNGTIVSGATSSSYTTSFTKKGTNTFYVEVWNACNATHVRSNTVTITVN